MKNPIIKASILAATPLFIAGCFETNIEKATIKECNVLVNAYRNSSDEPIENVKTNLDNAKKMAKILFDRTNFSKGSINLGTIEDTLMAPDGYRELTSDKSLGELDVLLSDEATKGGASIYEFNSSNGKDFHISVGAIACSGKDGLLYPTNLYDSLEKYVIATNQLATLDK